ncbi:MAG: hypothetical protein KAR06_08310 [Deltaproteobacteria bacterium]|nr:hypothetical protein [Deltaproteobacteria bacterium]
MGSLFPKPIPAERIPITLDHGIAVPGAPVDVSTNGSMQPFTGKVPEKLVNLQTAKGFIDVYCDDKLKVAEPGSDTIKGDIVIFDGGRWEVVVDKTHNQDIINHFHFIASYIGSVA